MESSGYLSSVVETVKGSRNRLLFDSLLETGILLFQKRPTPIRNSKAHVGSLICSYPSATDLTVD